MSTRVARPARIRPRRSGVTAAILDRRLRFEPSRNTDPISERQLQIVHELNVAFNADGDWPRFYHDDADLHMPPEWPEESTYRGKAGLEAAVRAWREGFDEYHWVEERVIDADGCVVGLYYQRGRTKGGGPWIDQAIGALFWFRGDKIIRLEGFFSWADALEAAGIDEPEATGS